jgi:hypothetical protein
LKQKLKEFSKKDTAQAIKLTDEIDEVDFNKTIKLNPRQI